MPKISEFVHQIFQNVAPIFGCPDLFLVIFIKEAAEHLCI